MTDTRKIDAYWKERLRDASSGRAAGSSAPDCSPFVFLDAASRPYLAFRGWLHYWHADNKWVTLREIKPGERETLEARKLPDKQAALYGLCLGACLANAAVLPDQKTCLHTWSEGTCTTACGHTYHATHDDEYCGVCGRPINATGGEGACRKPGWGARPALSDQEKESEEKETHKQGDIWT